MDTRVIKITRTNMATSASRFVTISRTNMTLCFMGATRITNAIIVTRIGKAKNTKTIRAIRTPLTIMIIWVIVIPKPTSAIRATRAARTIRASQIIRTNRIIWTIKITNTTRASRASRSVRIGTTSMTICFRRASMITKAILVTRIGRAQISTIIKVFMIGRTTTIILDYYD